jgi:hypothetical protein
VPVTDPTLTATPDTFLLHRYRYFAGPNLSASSAAGLDANARNPIETSIAG